MNRLLVTSLHIRARTLQGDSAVQPGQGCHSFARFLERFHTFQILENPACLGIPHFVLGNPAFCACKSLVSYSLNSMAATQESVCRRCRTLFRREENSQEACRFHPKMFVSRKHDDQKRYYELKDGDPEYPARFYDCCGAEDPTAPEITSSA
ncbi:unnamed protein product [Closterium sp. Yama58-4]|nr:unnamed protein product [Closterium sp. Yama58-4]